MTLWPGRRGWLLICLALIYKHKNVCSYSVAFSQYRSHESVRVSAIATDTDYCSGNVYWMVPKNTNTLFIGRNDILEKLDHSLGPQSNS